MMRNIPQQSTNGDKTKHKSLKPNEKVLFRRIREIKNRQRGDKIITLRWRRLKLIHQRFKPDATNMMDLRNIFFRVIPKSKNET
jgi:hypothetical protein